MIVLGKASDGRVHSEFEGLANLVMCLRVIPYTLFWILS